MSLQKYIDYLISLTQDEIQSLRFYTNDCALSNTLVRKGKKLFDAENRYYSNILKIFSNGPKITEALTVYRGVKLKSVHDCRDYSGFISTTIRKDVSEEFTSSSSKCCVFKIIVPPGDYTVLPLYHISEYPSEEEILLPPGDILVTGEEGPGVYTCVYTHKGNMTSFEYATGETGIDFKTNEEWLEFMIQDIPEEVIDEATDYYFTKYRQDKLAKGHYKKFIVVYVLSELDYYNDIPEEVINEYLEKISMLFQ